MDALYNLDPFGRNIVDFAFASPGSNTLMEMGSKCNNIALSAKFGKVLLLQAGDSPTYKHKNIEKYKHISTDKQKTYKHTN